MRDDTDRSLGAGLLGLDDPDRAAYDIHAAVGDVGTWIERECARHRAAGRYGPQEYPNGAVLHVPPADVPDVLVKCAATLDMPDPLAMGKAYGASPWVEAFRECVVLERALFYGEEFFRVGGGPVV